MIRATPDREGTTGTQRDTTSSIECPACGLHVPKGSIDESALSTEAKQSLHRNDRRQAFKSTRTAVDEMRAAKARRIRGKYGDE